MSSRERREELRREQEQWEIEREAEERRIADLTWFERIEEISDIHDAKAVLHEIVDHLDEVLISRGGFRRERS